MGYIKQELLSRLAYSLLSHMAEHAKTGRDETYYYANGFELCSDEWEPCHLSIRRDGSRAKVLGFNPYISSTVYWYGSEKDFDALWQIITNHDEIVDKQRSEVPEWAKPFE